MIKYSIEDEVTVRLFIYNCEDGEGNSTYGNPFKGIIRYANTLKQFRGILRSILDNTIEEWDYPIFDCIVMIGEGIAWKYLYAVGDLKTEDYLEEVPEKDKEKFIEWYKREYGDKNFTGKISDSKKYLFTKGKNKYDIK